jgi:hypothetical protein
LGGYHGSLRGGLQGLGVAYDIHITEDAGIAGSGGRNFADKDLYEDYSGTAGGYGRTYSMTEYGGCGGGSRN